MRDLWVYLPFAILIGALGGIHVPINGSLSTRIESPFVATFTFYGVAFLAIGLVNALLMERDAFARIASIPPWMWIVPGLISVVVVGGNTFLIPRLGAVNMFVIAVATQIVVRTVISHFGWLDSPVDPVRWSKVLGALMVCGGAILVVKR